MMAQVENKTPRILGLAAVLAVTLVIYYYVFLFPILADVVHFIHWI